MEKIIFAYLSQSYIVQASQIGNDGLYKIEHAQKVANPIDGRAIIKELQEIFGLSEEQIFIMVNDWCLEQKPTADLFFYWKSNSEIAHSGPNGGFQKHYLGTFDASTKLSRTNFKMSLLQQYVSNYQYR